MGKTRGAKISKEKHRNVMTHKLHVRKKRTKDSSRSIVHNQMQSSNRELMKKKTSRELMKKKTSREQIDPTEDHSFINEMMSMMDEEDINFLMECSDKHRKEIDIREKKRAESLKGIMNRVRSGLNPLERSSKRRKRSKRKEEEEEYDPQSKYEDDYEEELSRKYEQDSQSKQTKYLLPIKTKDRIILQSTEVDVLEEEKKVSEECSKGEIKEEEKEMDEDIINRDISEALVSIADNISQEEVLEKQKLKIGILATRLLEAPEMNMPSLKILLEMLNDEHLLGTVRKLLVLSLLEIFKDLLPSYELKPRIETKHKKETLNLIKFEESLLKYYKEYLLCLDKMMNVFKTEEGKCLDNKFFGILALRCMSELLKNNPYFNFSKTIAEKVATFLNSRSKEARIEALKGLEAVFKEDKRGLLSLQIVRRIKTMALKMTRTVHPEVLLVLLALKLKSVDLEAENINRLKEKALIKRRSKLINTSRKEHQRKKRLEELEKQLEETKAKENQDTRQKNLTEAAKCVFGIIFRVLKLSPTGKLLNVALAVLSKFAHCLSYEFFQDIVNMINNILKEVQVNNLQRIHCVETIFNILSGEGEVLNIDPMRFYTHLYQCITDILTDKSSEANIAILRILETALITRRRQVSLPRLLGFIKRLCTIAVYSNHGNAVGFLEVVRKIMKLSRNCDILLDIDASFGTGVYLPEVPEPEYCCANNTALWELNVLCRHYHPYVSEMAFIIMNPESKKTPPVELTKLSPAEIAEKLDSKHMGFRPAVPLPPQTAPLHYRGKLTFTNDDFTIYVQNIENSVCDPASLDVAGECEVF